MAITPFNIALAEAPASAKGALEVSRNKLILTTPPDKPPHGSLRYALAFPFQVSADTMGLMVMRMTEETPYYGFLDGSDVVLLNDFTQPDAARIFAVNRNEVEQPPGEQARIVLKSPLMGGFVPFGALNADGTPHPHAGTGFGIAQAHRFPMTADGGFSWGDPARFDMNELYQLAYDGETFKSQRSGAWSQNGEERWHIGNTGWFILVSGISNAIPDGHDLLFPALVSRDDRTALSVGVVRWARRDGEWRPIDFDPVVVDEMPVPEGPNPMERCVWMEPSLARESDGSLLFTARGPGMPSYNLRVWRSREAGKWQQVFDQEKSRMNSPVTVNVTADGSAYLAATQYDPAFDPETAETGRGREKLMIWELTADRTGVGPPQLIRDCVAEFGDPPAISGPEKWMVDHPNSITVRLKDGQWHHLLCYRICHSPPYSSHGTPPSPHSGSYVEEVTSRGPAIPVWRFENEK